MGKASLRFQNLCSSPLLSRQPNKAQGQALELHNEILKMILLWELQEMASFRVSDGNKVFGKKMIKFSLKGKIITKIVRNTAVV